MDLSALTQKAGPLPVYIWIAGGGLIFAGIGLYLRHKGGSGSQGGLIVNSASPSESGGGVGGSGAVTPGTSGTGGGAPPPTVVTPPTVFTPPVVTNPNNTPGTLEYQISHGQFTIIGNGPNGSLIASPGAQGPTGMGGGPVAAAPSWNALQTPSHTQIATELIQNPGAPFGHPNWGIIPSQATGQPQLVNRYGPGVAVQGAGGQMTYFRPRL